MKQIFDATQYRQSSELHRQAEQNELNASRRYAWKNKWFFQFRQFPTTTGEKSMKTGNDQLEATEVEIENMIEETTCQVLALTPVEMDDLINAPITAAFDAIQRDVARLNIGAVS